MPQSSVDPVVMAAATVMRLQTVVSREVAAAEAAVVTIGAYKRAQRRMLFPTKLSSS
jgi:metal-dependent amidase/aminoacylase/carboxypeptidase family protein